MEQDSGISSIRKSPPVANLSKMDQEHSIDVDSMFNDYGGKQKYMDCMREAEDLHGRPYRSALEQAIYLTWSTGKKHVVATLVGCGSLVYEAVPEMSILDEINVGF